MTHVTGGTNSSVQSSQTTRQAEKQDNQSDALFENIFSIVSELDPDSIDFISSELKLKLNSEEKNVWQVIEANLNDSDTLTGDPEEKNNSNLATAIGKLRLLLNEKHSPENMVEDGLEEKIVSLNLTNSSNKNNASEINSNEIKTEKNPAAHPFSRQTLAYANAKLNSLPTNKLSNFYDNPASSDDLTKVIKLIEQAIVSKESNNNLSDIKTEKSFINTSKLKNTSALDKAMEVLDEQKVVKNTNAGLENLESLKKKETISVSKDSFNNKDFLNTQVYKIPNLKPPLINSLNSKSNLKENTTGTLTRQVELSQQLTSNATSQSNIQNNSLDMHSGGNSGQDSHEYQSQNQILRANSPLSTIQKLNMADKAWKEVLVRQIETQLKDGNKTLDISLNPKQLGRMTVSINISGDDASIQISTETSAAANILLESEGKLAQMMQDIGLRLSLLQASFSSKHEKETKQGSDNEKLSKDTKESLEDKTGLNKTNLGKIDNSILNIIA